jgi:hypothetical protein
MPNFGPISQRGKAHQSAVGRQDPEFLQQQSSIIQLFTPTNSAQTVHNADAQLRQVVAGMYMSLRISNGLWLSTS